LYFLVKILLIFGKFEKNFMVLTPLHNNFLIKVSKVEELQRREMDGSLYLHPNYVYMTRNTQCGVIVGVSAGAKKEFPEAEIGDMLLIHHFVQRSHSTKGDNDKFLVFEYENYRYYNVVAKEGAGNNNMAYGIYRNGVIIPHPQYVFLKKEIDNNDGYYQTPEQVHEKLAEIKSSVEYLAKQRMTSEIKMEMMKREAEMMKLNKTLQTKEYLPYKISFAHPSLNIDNGTPVYALSIACQTVTEWNGTEYRVAETRFIGAV
jgi:hypothetical protein